MTRTLVIGRDRALLSQGQRVAWAGPSAEAARHAGSADEVVHAEDALLLPAFADAHVHLTMTGQGLDGIDLSGTRSVAEALRLVETAARHTRGRPLYAHSWDETRWAEGRPVTTAELDRAAWGGVVYMPRIDAHSASVSSAMAAVARVRGMAGWDGSGVVTREAFTACTNAFTAGITDSDREHYLDLALRAAAEQGIGLVHETGADHLTSATDVHAVLAAGRRPGTTSTVAYWGAGAVDQAEAAELGRHLGVLGLAGDLCADGSFGSRTAHLTQPYLDAPESVGYGYLEVDHVRDHVVACVRAGLQSGGHVIGDAALQTMAAGFRAAAEVVGVEALRASRPRWEHVELPDLDVLTTMAELGIWASVQPGFDAAWGGTEGMYAARLGGDRALAANPLRALLDAGVSLAFGSDSPVTPLGPWAAVQAACWHHNPGQRLTVQEAFDAHTTGGYALAGQDGGRLQAGDPATYVLWDVPDGQPLTPTGLPDLAARRDLPLPTARRTVVDGHPTFVREGA